MFHQSVGIEIVFSLMIFVVILTLPGYFWTLAFFPEKKSLDRIERFAFSVFFSITIMPLFVLIENTVFRVPINFFSVFSTLFFLIIVSILIYIVRTQRINAPQFLHKFFPKTKKEDSVNFIPKIF